MDLNTFPKHPIPGSDAAIFSAVRKSINISIYQPGNSQVYIMTKSTKLIDFCQPANTTYQRLMNYSINNLSTHVNRLSTAING